MRNVFNAILEFGHDEEFAPTVTDSFSPTGAPAGSAEKLEVMARRIREGLPLWHPDDRRRYQRPDRRWSARVINSRRLVHDGNELHEMRPLECVASNRRKLMITIRAVASLPRARPAFFFGLPQSAGLVASDPCVRRNFAQRNPSRFPWATAHGRLPVVSNRPSCECSACASAGLCDYRPCWR